MKCLQKQSLISLKYFFVPYASYVMLRFVTIILEFIVNLEFRIIFWSSKSNNFNKIKREELFGNKHFKAHVIHLLVQLVSQVIKLNCQFRLHLMCGNNINEVLINFMLSIH